MSRSNKAFSTQQILESRTRDSFFADFSFLKSSLMFCVLMLITLLVNAQSVNGKWKSVDDNSGEPKSVVEITERNGKISGKVIRIFVKQGEDPDPVCDQCPMDDSRFNKKIIGMDIILEMERTGDEYIGGTILDPEVGKVYRCKIWREGEELKVRGYVGPFFRTQTWLKFIP